MFFYTLTWAGERLKGIYDNPNVLRECFNNIGKMVLDAVVSKANASPGNI